MILYSRCNFSSRSARSTALISPIRKKKVCLGCASDAY